MKKLTIFGTPINPRPLLEELEGSSFCVSYASRAHLKNALDTIIAMTAEDGMILVDNGAWSLHQAGEDTMSEEHLAGFAEWARDLLNRAPQAVAVVPDVIDGTEAENKALAEKWTAMIAASGQERSRWMGMWHTSESIEFLIWLCERFNFVGVGSSPAHDPNKPAWAKRIAEAFAAIEAWEAETGSTRPRLHLMRAQSKAHLFPFDSSDSCNVAMNHGRARKRGVGIKEFAGRIDKTIQASAGPEARHQAERPLWAPALVELHNWFHSNFEIKRVPKQGEFEWKEAA